MNTVMKAVMAGLISVGIGTAAVVAYAHETGCREGAGRQGRDRDSFSERMEQRKTELHDKLKLKSEQEAAWTTFTEKMKPTLPKERPDREEFKKLPAPERMGKMIEMMKAHEGQMENRLVALKDFYATLTPEQQKIFDEQSALRFSRRSGAMRHDHHSGTDGQ